MQTTNKIYKQYITNNIRVKKIKSRYLLVNDNGSFVDLSKEEYINFSQNKLDSDLFNSLESKGMIITKDNEKEIIRKFRQKNSFLYEGTTLHIIIPTLRCNQKCTYCHASSKHPKEKNYDMDIETAKKTVDFIFQSPAGGYTIEFQGGEPLLNFPVVKYIIEYAKKKNNIHKKRLRFALVSNMTLINDEIIDYLNKEKISLCTSLDGPKKVHDVNRKYLQGNGSYDDVIKGIEKIKKKKCKVHALMTTTKHSLPYYKEIIDEYKKHNFQSIFIRFVSDLGYAKEIWDDLEYSAEEFLEFYKNSIDYIIKNKIRIRESWSQIILCKILGEKDPGFLDLRSPCGAAIGQLAYLYEGSIYSCDEGRMVSDFFKLGTVNQTYKEVLTSNETCSLVASSVNDTHLCDKCVYKPYCGLCPVCNYAYEGNLIPKLAMDKRCKILKGIFDYIFEKLLFDEEYRKVFKKWAGTGF